MSVVSGFKEYHAPKLNRREILRYMSCEKATAETEKLLDKCISESETAFSFRVVYTELPIVREENLILLGGMKIYSRELAKNLTDCNNALVFAATVGLVIDRLILKYSHASPSSALCMQAIGTERIESLCELFCLEMKDKYSEQNMLLRPRFSPGYGDLPLELQRDIFSLLECEKRLGMTLNNSLLISPTKSVTAIIGIKEKQYENS